MSFTGAPPKDNHYDNLSTSCVSLRTCGEIAGIRLKDLKFPFLVTKVNIQAS